MKPKVIPAGILALLLLAAACAKSTPIPVVDTPAAQIDSAPTLTVAAPTVEAPSGVAATVNGQPIPLSTYQAQLQTAITSYTAQPGLDPKSADAQAALAALREQVLDWLIDQAIIDQAAARQGIKVDDAAVNAEVERIRSQNAAGFADWLKANGFTEETFRVQTRSDLLGAAMRDLVTKDVSNRGEQVRLRHILVDTQAEARAILDQIRQGKATFEALAKQHSKDETTRAAGGDMGFMPRGLLAESVEKVAFAMQPGQISDPVQSPFGWHILLLVAKEPNREIPPDMLATLRQEVFMRWLDAEREKAQVQRMVQ